MTQAIIQNIEGIELKSRTNTDTPPFSEQVGDQNFCSLNRVHYFLFTISCSLNRVNSPYKVYGSHPVPVKLLTLEMFILLKNPKILATHYFVKAILI